MGTIEYDFEQLQNCVKKLNSLRRKISEPKLNEFWVNGDSGSGEVHSKTFEFSKSTKEYYMYLKELLDNVYDYITSSEILKQIDSSIADTFLEDLYSVEIENPHGGLNNSYGGLGNSYGTLGKK